MDSICLAFFALMIVASLDLGSSASKSTSKNSTCSQMKEPCLLPYCYCNYKSIPGGLELEATPQMVLITYQGYIDEDIFDLIYENLWQPKFINPDGCRLGMTIFSAYEGSNNCSIHKLYTIGYEISLGVSGGDAASWDSTVVSQRHNLTEGSVLDVDHIQGMRANKELPGGDPQFKALVDNGFSYDSSLLYVPTTQSEMTPWPFTIDLPLKDLKFTPEKTQSAPTIAYNGVWEVPIVRLVATSSSESQPRQCTFMRDCMSGMKTTEDVERLLMQMLNGRRKSNRAPMMINLDIKTLKNQRMMLGLRNFLRNILHGDYEDIWVVSIEQMLDWVRAPTSSKSLSRGQSVDICTRNRKYHRCDPTHERKGRPSSNFRVFMNVEVLYIYQSVFLVVFYIVLVRYDRMQANKKK